MLIELGGAELNLKMTYMGEYMAVLKREKSC